MQPQQQSYGATKPTDLQLYTAELRAAMDLFGLGDVLRIMQQNHIKTTSSDMTGVEMAEATEILRAHIARETARREVDEAKWRAERQARTERMAHNEAVDRRNAEKRERRAERGRKQK